MPTVVMLNKWQLLKIQDGGWLTFWKSLKSLYCNLYSLRHISVVS